jgi:hypothetical protein
VHADGERIEETVIDWQRHGKLPHPSQRVPHPSQRVQHPSWCSRRRCDSATASWRSGAMAQR